jgi:hypothetical protein
MTRKQLKKLLASERQHLRDVQIKDLRALCEARKFQTKNPAFDRCLECRSIAQKLGV